MRNPRTVLTEAYAPDADRVGPGAPDCPPDWLVHLVVCLILLLLECLPAENLRRVLRLPSRRHDRPDQALGSLQQLAASIRGDFGNAIACMCRRNGIGPGHADWPELSRAILAFGGSVQGFHPGMPGCGLQWWENPHIAGMPGAVTAAPPVAAMASLLARHELAPLPQPVPQAVTAEAAPTLLPALPRRPRARAATGPPTGPPLTRGCLT